MKASLRHLQGAGRPEREGLLNGARATGRVRRWRSVNLATDDFDRLDPSLAAGRKAAISSGGGDPIGDGVATLGAAVQRQLGDAMEALRTADLQAADAVVRGDVAINEARYSLEGQVTAELGIGGASPERLRFLVAVLSVVNDLERMGDHCEGIAKVALMLGDTHAVPLPALMPRLGEMVEAMLSQGLASFTNRDAEAAERTSAGDDAVDEMYDTLYSELLSAMAVDRSQVIAHTYLLWVAHNLERIADRVTNVCERTVYLVTGRIDELNVSNY